MPDRDPACLHCAILNALDAWFLTYPPPDQRARELVSLIALTAAQMTVLREVSGVHARVERLAEHARNHHEQLMMVVETHNMECALNNEAALAAISTKH